MDDADPHLSDPELRDPTMGGYFEASYATDDDARPQTPFQHVHQRRAFLGSLRGGIGLALIKALTSIAVNLAVIFGGILILAVPVALLSRSDFGAVTNTVADQDQHPGDLRDGAWYPAMWLVLFGCLAFIASWLFERSRRRVVLNIAAAFVGLATGVVAITIALPWLAHRLDDIWHKSWWATLPAIVTWAGGLALAFLRPRLSKIAIRLGGVLSGVAMFYVFVGIIRRIVEPNARPEWSRLPNALDPSSQWWIVMAIAALCLVAIDHTGVQWWSLHPLYRDRLAGTFAMKKDGQYVAKLPHGEWPRWSQLKARSQTPNHVICCATHRRKSTVTGLKSLSYRIEKDGVSFHEPEVNAGREIVNNRFTASTPWLETAFGIPASEENAGVPEKHQWWRLWRRPHARSTAVAAAAMSGAAFNSVMGRQSKGTTDSLLAVLNLRLGVWMPNNRFETSGALGWLPKVGGKLAQRKRKFPRPGLRYLFHEVIGHFDIEDPFVHVSDGGHWENLGLTEAIRDRRRQIIVVDATGETVEPDTDGKGFSSLNEAIDLARIELATEILIDVSAMRPDVSSGRAAQNWATGTIKYHKDRVHNWSKPCGAECRDAELLYVKAVVCDRTPEWVLAFANTDRVFPNYPTGDQFLKGDQFDALVRLGVSATADGLVAAKIRAPR